MKTRMEMINSKVMLLDFFKKVNEFEEQGEASQPCQ